MRIAAWNLGHQVRERPITKQFHDAVSALAPDVLILNEYVHGPTRDAMIEALKGDGLEHHLVSARLNGHNQVLVASRYDIRQGDLRGPLTHDRGGESNFLHVIFPGLPLELVGVRVPAWPNASVLRDYWAKFAALARSVMDRNIIFIGDFNADPDTPSYVGSAALAALRVAGWKVPAPTGPWSYASGTRIDHVIASPKRSPLRTAYVAEIGELTLASPDRSKRISDHAALVVEVEIPDTAA